MDVDDDVKGTISLVDLASRKSDIQCDTPPDRLVSAATSSRYAVNGKIVGYDNPMRQACSVGDLEAFVNICDMAKNLPEPQYPDSMCLNNAIFSDSADIVDETIRRTGIGIDLEQLEEVETDQQESETKPESKLYLGLTVHGKKRKDLAKHAGNAQSRDQSQIPLLWLAIRSRCNKVIEYLSGPSVLAAYRYYAATQSTDRAEGLRKIQNLEQRLPDLLGVSVNRRRESALTAAMLGPAKEERLTMMKRVVALNPSQAKNFLHSP